MVGGCAVGAASPIGAMDAAPWRSSSSSDPRGEGCLGRLGILLCGSTRRAIIWTVVSLSAHVARLARTLIACVIPSMGRC